MNSSRASSKSSKVRRTSHPTNPEAPFDLAILEQAREIVAGYRFIIRPSDGLGYTGYSLEFPLVFGSGKTPEECLRKAVFSAETTVATMLERGQMPPTSVSRRSEQINIRLTSEEKLLLEEESQRNGYKGLSDYVRAVALAGTAGGPRR